MAVVEACTAVVAFIATAFAVGQEVALTEWAFARTGDLARHGAWPRATGASEAPATSARSETVRRLGIILRIFIPRRTMDSGILSAAPAVPHISAEDAIRGAGRTQASLRVMLEDPTEFGTLLAHQEAFRQGARRVF